MSETNRIHPLPLHLANQIAAGEVIERPASVIKELIENSIDAGASQIDIETEGAGSQLIRVRDNGSGIHPQDLALALSRHATSKLHSSEQLSAISSLGFRGEALPSIASIAKLTLTSRQADSDHGYQMSGDSETSSPASHPYGSTFEIRDLFFNVPARRHFLRSDKTEQHHILVMIQRLALSQFHIGFSYKAAAVIKLKLPIATTREQQQQRIGKIAGRSFVANSLYLEQHYKGITLKGWLGKAEAHRAQTDLQHFFINGRIIRDRVINHAIRQAYGDLIPVSRQAAYVLYLTLPVASLDVNVHPTKHEVRFRNARLIHDLINTAISEALNPQNNPNASLSNTPQQHDLVAQQSSSVIEDKQISDADNEILTLLDQGYLIQQTANETRLLDLHTASLELRRQQLRDAIQEDNLRCRPILVPIAVTTDKVLITTALQHASTLEKLAIHCKQQADRLIVTAIPSLLTHVNISEFVLSILTAIADQNAANDDLIALLCDHLPVIPITSIDQAKQLIQQLNNTPIAKKWQILLDKPTLSSLFSF